MIKTNYIWKNGEQLPWEESSTHVLTHALHYGSAVFEGIRAYNTENGPAIFRAEEHFQRLHYSADCYNFKVPYTVEELLTATKELINDSGLESCYIRPLVYFGYDKMGILPYENPIDTIIAIWGWGTYLGEESLEKGIRCKVSKWTKLSSTMLPATAKCSANYANSILAKKEIVDQGYDEAILCNSNGRISEGPGENIFVIKDGAVITPPIEEDVLDGITCQTIYKLCQDLNIPVSKQAFGLDQLLDADEVFLTGTAAEVTPVREINDQNIGNGARGPITTQLQSLYFDIIHGRNNTYKNWLTYTKEP